MSPKRSGPRKRLVRIRRGKPVFRRQESWRYKRVDESWRRPTGGDSKMRLRKKGWPPIVRVGYRSPRIIRGLHPSGLEEVLVHNPSELEGLDPKTRVVRIAHVVGRRKRAAIVEAAEEMGFVVLNPGRKEEEEEGEKKVEE